MIRRNVFLRKSDMGKEKSASEIQDSVNILITQLMVFSYCT